MNNNFHMTKMAAALATAGLLAVPSLAFATNPDTTEIGAASLRAPVVGTTFTPAFGLSARHAFVRTPSTVAGNLDGMEAVAFLYDAAGAYVGFVRGGYANKTSQATTATVTVPPSSSGATQVVFAMFYHGDEALASNSSDDSLGSLPANKAAVLFVPTATTGRTSFTPTLLNASNANGGVYQTANGPTSAQLNAIGAHASVNDSANRVAIDSTYGGPVLTGAAKDAITPSLVRFNFNAALREIGDGTDVSATMVTKAGAAVKGTPVAQNGLARNGSFSMHAGDSVFYADHNDLGGFVDAVDTVTVAAGSTTVQDEAGNPAKVNNAGVAISLFALPAYSATGTVGIVSNNDTDTIGSLTQTVGEAALYSAAGVKLTSDDQLELSLRMSEAMLASSWSDPDDVAIASGTTAFPASVGTFGTANNDQTLTVRFTPGNNTWFRVDTATGKLQYGGNGGGTTAGTYADVTATVKKGGGALTTLEGRALTADLAATSVFAGDAPPVTAPATNDADANGFIDGVRINYNAPIAALGATPGFALKVNGGTNPTLPATFAISGTSPSTIIGTITNPAAADWNADGTANAAADNAIYTQTNFGTGVTNGAKYSFGFTQGTGAATYASIFNAATGNLRQLPTRAASSGDFTDGASPLITKAVFNTLQGTTPAKGNLVLTASENLDNTGPNGSQYSAAGSPLTLLNLNDGLGNVSFSHDGDTITINDVTASVATKLLTIGATPGYRDAASNNISTAPAGVAIAAGNTVFTAPKLTQAIAARAGGGVGANINQIVLRLSKPVQFAPVGKVFNSDGEQSGLEVTTPVTAVEDGQFKVKAQVPGIGEVVIPMRSIDVDLSQAATGYITLNIPTPGIIGTAETINVKYTQGNAAGARLVSTDTGTNGPTVLPSGSHITAQLANNSRKILVQDMSGKLTTDGTAPVENGTIVRADLVKFDPVVTALRGTVRVPCDCSAGTQLVTLDLNDGNFSGVNGVISEARRVGQSAIRVYVKSFKPYNRPSVVTAALVSAPEDGRAPGIWENGETQYEASLDVTTGAITSASGVSGNVVITNVPALTVLDTTHQVITATSNGAFRMSTGVNSPAEAAGAFWIVSVKRPTDRRFRMITSAVPSFVNHVPFRQETLGTGNTITANIGTVNMTNLIDVPVAPTHTWQMLPIKGVVSLTSDPVRKALPVPMERLFMNVHAANGEPNTAWAGDSDADQAFSLVGNTLSQAVQVASLPAASLDNIKSLTGGFGLAMINPDSNYRVPSWNENVSIDPAGNPPTPLFITIPVSAANSAAATVPAGWSLITMNANKDLSVTANQGNITAAILVGAGQQSKTWFKGETSGNTLTTLEAGKSYFVNFSAATTGFTF
jgi:hypothetical protein